MGLGSYRGKDENQDEDGFNNAEAAIDELLELVFQFSITPFSLVVGRRPSI